MELPFYPFLYMVALRQNSDSVSTILDSWWQNQQEAIFYILEHFSLEVLQFTL